MVIAQSVPAEFTGLSPALCPPNAWLYSHLILQMLYDGPGQGMNVIDRITRCFNLIRFSFGNVCLDIAV